MSEELELTIDGEMVGRIDKQLGHHFDQFFPITNSTLDRRWSRPC